ncbi:MAG TPA: trypsin [Phycisphaerales bacterium]|nr:trypsin [Phycisphaerales bacterium]
MTKFVSIMKWTIVVGWTLTAAVLVVSCGAPTADSARQESTGPVTAETAGSVVAGAAVSPSVAVAGSQMSRRATLGVPLQWDPTNSDVDELLVIETNYASQAAEYRVGTVDRERADKQLARNMIAMDDVQACRQPPSGSDPVVPGCGTLTCIPVGVTNPDEYVPVPLDHTAVDADVSGFISRVQVTQQFTNPYNEKIEAVYVFPLPQDSAVSDFIMKIGDRTIRGIIREREEARRIYEEARSQGHVASLLQQERPNIFTQKVANIEPGKSIDIDITYFGALPYRNGGFEFVFPMVVGPRYNPPGSSDPIHAVPRGGAQYTTDGTAVSYLAPNERSGHDIDINLTLDAGVSIESLKSPTHAVTIDRTSPVAATVKLSPLDTIPNRDFVLRWEVAGEDLKTAMLTHTDERGGYFTLMLVPPAELAGLDRAPMEMVFVIDCSGSMRGEPLALARQAVKRALRSMQPGDTFQIIRFSQSAAQMAPQPLAATADNVAAGIRYLDALEAGGGTNMIYGIKSALAFNHDDTHVRSVVFMTDGYIGNEPDILGEIGRNLGDARIFSFGIGSSPNRYLLQRMADMGNGVASFIGQDNSAIDAMDEYFELVSHPALHDVTLDVGGGVSEVYPANIPDVFVGRPIFVSGRLGQDFDGDITITGLTGGEPLELDCEWTGHGDRPAIAQIWARTLIKDLSDRMIWSTEEGLQQKIQETALAYNLASAFTSFVAVDSSRVTEGEHGTTVHVPVPVPSGVRYDTTVGGTLVDSPTPPAPVPGDDHIDSTADAAGQTRGQAGG